MFPVYFSALLKSANGNLLEIGEACVSRTDNKITFKNEFVPLVKLNTRVEIVRVLGNKQLERFCGTVYLSSRSLLQIVDVDEKLIQAIRELFDINTYLPAVFSLSPDKSPDFNRKKCEPVPGMIRYVSETVVKVSLLPYVGEGRYLIVECAAPLELRNTMLRVEKRELLGRQAALLICSVVSAPAEETARLHDYSQSLRKLDEDVDTENDPPSEEPLYSVTEKN